MINIFEKIKKCEDLECIDKICEFYNLKYGVEIDFINKIKKFFGFAYKAKIYLYNDIIAYEVDCEILEADKIFITIYDVKVF